MGNKRARFLRALNRFIVKHVWYINSLKNNINSYIKVIQRLAADFLGLRTSREQNTLIGSHCCPSERQFICLSEINIKYPDLGSLGAQKKQPSKSKLHFV